MMKRLILKLFTTALLVGLICANSFAQMDEGEQVTPIGGATEIRGALLSQIPVSTTTTYTTAGEYNRVITNIITFKIDEAMQTFFASGFNANVTLTVTGTDISGNALPAINNLTLSVNYDNALGAKFKTGDYKVLQGYASCTVSVTGFQVTGASGWDPKSVLVVVNEMRALRYFNMVGDPTDFSPIYYTNTVQTNADERLLEWYFPNDLHESMSQLEWTFVENEMLPYYNSNYALLFQSNSSRVDVVPSGKFKKYIYKIPLLYPGPGKLFYRIRAVKRKTNGTLVCGPWTNVDASTGNIDFVGHEVNAGGQSRLNWQSSISYAEEGKYKSVIQYYDGSLRARQTVTKDNATGNVVVGETIYDLQGRPNIQILPTPIKQTAIRYFDNINKFNSLQQTYDNPAKYFDLTLGDVCVASPALVSTSGTSQYYSANNEWLPTENKTKFIPDAEGFSYTETRYTDDATQRVKQQGGVGAEHRIGSGRETKYYYGKPAQAELDALFGTEVGDAGHYFKNMVSDANGQLSVSYVDMHGRTVATALAGTPNPDKMASIVNTQDYPLASGDIREDLVTPTTNIIQGKSIVASSTLLSTSNTKYRFVYSLQPDILQLTKCTGGTLCYDCKYNLEISIKGEECGSQINFTYLYNNLALVINNTCSTSMGFVQTDVPGATPVYQIVLDNIYLPPGSYSIRKTLSIDDSSYNARRAEALSNLLCKTKETLYQTIYDSLVTTSGCGQTTTQQCQACLDSLGTPATFAVKYINSYYPIVPPQSEIDAAYAQAKEQCNILCGTTVNTEFATLANIRKQMLADMLPFTGQYAVETEAGTVSKRFNIFSTTSGYFIQPYYKNPKTEANDPYYKDEAGQNDPDLYGGAVNLSSLNAIDFTSMFKPSWAKSLIKYHPEYPKLLYAETPEISACYSWMDRVFAGAYSVDSAYIQPITATGANDPYFSLSGTETQRSELYQKLISNIRIGDASSPSVWQIANSSYLCATIPDVPVAAKIQCIKSLRTDGMDPNVPVNKRNEVWERFKSIYFNLRNDYLLDRIQGNQVTTGGLVALSQGDMNTLTTVEDKELLFAKPQDIANQNGWTWWAGVTNPTGIDTSAIPPYLASNTTSMCEAMRPVWKAKLLQCTQLANIANSDSTLFNNIINQILNGLVSVCNNSRNAQQPYGASNVAPGYTGNPQNFEDVFNAVLSANGIQTQSPANLFCNPYTIDFPKPYGLNPPVFTNYSNVVDSCACNRFSSLKLEAAALGFNTASLSSFNQFLWQNYNDTLSQVLWNGLQNCNNLYTDTCVLEKLQTESKLASKIILCPKPTISSISFLNGNLLVSGSIASSYCGSPAVYVYNATNTLLQTYNFSCNSTSCEGAVCFTLNLGPRDSCGYYKIVVKSTTSTCGTMVSDTAYRNGCPPPCPTVAPIVTGVSATTILGSPSLAVNYILPANCNNSTLYLASNSGSIISTVLLSCNSTSHTFEKIDTCGLYRIYIQTTRTGCTTLTSNLYDYRCGSLPPCYKYTPILLPEPVVIPPVLSCGYVKPCLSCDKLVNVLTPQFRSIFPQFSGVPFLSTSTTDEQQAQNSLWARFINYKTGFSKNTLDYLRAYQNCTGGTPPVNAICAFDPPANSPADIYPSGGSPCQSVSEQAMYMATLMLEKIKDSILARFDSLYLQKCITSAASNEVFYVEYKPMEYHYTLYYYDQAGNLVKTLPPAAVKPNYNAAYLYSVKIARQIGNDYTNSNNNDALATHYRYNTLNQVVAQKTPDAGTSRFWYDRLGRLAVSQNAKQAQQGKYSYTMYDELGRITQVGQKPQTTAMTQAISQDATALANWLRNSPYATNPGTITGGLKEQITRTVYDVSYYDGDNVLGSTIVPGQQPVLAQANLRNRVSYTQLIDVEPTDYETNPKPYLQKHSTATYYKYDIHGNVDELVQDFGNSTTMANAMNSGANRFKKIQYTYDLISGKVNSVVYQPGMIDEFTHLYKYDAENRLTSVKSSHDGIWWETEAAYEYYRHGPLSRTILGQNNVQGLDYAYTLQGWLKGVNSTAASPEFDMGADGYNGSISVARDAFGFSLNYYSNDYIKIGASAQAPFTAVPSMLAMPVDGVKPGTNLYNGNIRAMLVNIPKLGDAKLYGYKYDQLNRIVSMDVYTGLANNTNLFANNTPALADQYRERISYDPNGNIRTYIRNGANAANMPLAMDNLYYQYEKNTNGQIVSNKLRYVQDEALAGNYTEDIDSQTPLNRLQAEGDIGLLQASDNFGYDAIGNLIKDSKENISGIEWNVYGKIAQISKTDGTSIKYTYDAAGNRISKRLYSGLTETQATYYVRDASGNVMSIYTKDAAVNGGNLSQTEVSLYGSSRLGVLNLTRDVSAQLYKNFSNYSGSFVRGNKFFELTNHLGNVLATISDKKIGVSSNGNTVDYYNADVVTANDYYPFGMMMPGRKYQAGSGYRYGFNGQEKDNEINENIYTAQFWEYDSRIGRRWNVDPVYKESISNYSTFRNNPIIYVDPSGNTDYYNNVGAWIGSDGIDDGKKQIILTNSTAAIISAQTKLNKTITMDRTKYRDILDLPSDDFIKALDEGYTKSESTNNESAIVEGGSGKVYTKTSNSGSEVNIIPDVIAGGETTINQDAHTHPPIIVMDSKGGIIYGGDAVPSDASSTKTKVPGDMERAAQLNLPNPNMVLGYKGIKEQLDKMKGAKTFEDAKKILGESLLKKLQNPANAGVNLRIPTDKNSPFKLTKQITFYNGSNKKIASMTFQSFKNLVNKVKKHDPKTDAKATTSPKSP